MSFHLDLPLPSRSEPLRLDFAGMQWLLERSPRGVRCVAMEGKVCFEGLLGLPEEGGGLRLEASPPRFPLEIRLPGEVALAPEGQVRGHLLLPLLLSLSFLSPGGRAEELVEIRDPALRTGWREGEGYFHPWESGLHPGPRLPQEREGESGRRFWVRSRILNKGTSTVRIREIRASFRGGGIRLYRGIPMGPGLDWRLGPGGGLRLRPLPQPGGGRGVLRGEFGNPGGVAL